MKKGLLSQLGSYCHYQFKFVRRSKYNIIAELTDGLPDISYREN